MPLRATTRSRSYSQPLVTATASNGSSNGKEHAPRLRSAGMLERGVWRTAALAEGQGRLVRPCIDLGTECDDCGSQVQVTGTAWHRSLPGTGGKAKSEEEAAT